jgi:ubiquinone/menaquinone biosynthesis C-methylase UbiE
MKQWYESLFENYGKKYDQECFTQGTMGECDFIEKEINFNKSLSILDLGCGTGRHTIELVKRGYKVEGVDLSKSQLQRAREKASEQKVCIDFVQGDARNLPYQNQFDLVIMLCEGSFPLMETDEMNFQILQNAFKVLHQGGKLIFTTLNGLFPLFHLLKDSKTFDLMTFRDINKITFEDDDGNKKELLCNERYYVPSEITWMLKSLGFQQSQIFGAHLGAFSRNDTLTTEDFEMLVVAEK